MLATEEQWNEIEERSNRWGYMNHVERSKERTKKTGEVFTPTAVVIEMMKQMLKADNNCFAPGKTTLDPACGDGQMLEPVKPARSDWAAEIF